MRPLILSGYYPVTEHLKVVVGMKPNREDEQMFDRYVWLSRGRNVQFEIEEWWELSRMVNKIRDYFKGEWNSGMITQHYELLDIMFSGSNTSQKSIMVIIKSNCESVSFNEEEFNKLVGIRPCVDNHLQWLFPKIMEIERFLSNGLPIKDEKLEFEYEFFYKKDDAEKTD